MGKMSLNKNTLNVNLTKSFPAQRNISINKSSKQSIVSTANETEMTLSVTPRNKTQSKSFRKIPNFHRTMDNLSVSKSRSRESSLSSTKTRKPYLINGELPNYLRSTH